MYLNLINATHEIGRCVQKAFILFHFRLFKPLTPVKRANKYIWERLEIFSGKNLMMLYFVLRITLKVIMIYSIFMKTCTNQTNF